MPTHDIIDNREEIPLEHVKSLLRDSVSAKFAVGYFFTSGKGDRFHNGFFFTLSQLLAIKYKVRLLRGAAINREDFKESWLRTREELRV